MKISHAAYFRQILTSKLLFNKEIKETELNNLIKKNNFPCINIIYHVNELLKKEDYKQDDILNYKNILYQNRTILKKEFQNINKEILYDKNNGLFSKLSLINLIERIIKYGTFNNNIITKQTDSVLTLILFLNILETSIDEKYDIETTKNINNDTLNLLISIISYNQFSNDINHSNYLRLPYIYENYIKKDSKVLETFYNKNKYTIKNYILFMQFFNTITLNNSLIEQSIINNIAQKNPEITEYIKQHTFNYNNTLEKTNIKINSYIPYNELINKPFLMVDNYYIFINPNYQHNKIYNSLLKKIRTSLNDNNYFKRIFYSKLFENYCRDIAEIYVNKSKFKNYQFIREFKYKIDNNQDCDSSDFYITYKDVTIIFEIKSNTRFKEVTTEEYIKENEKFIKKEFEKKIITPLNQIENRLKEIKELDKNLYPKIPLEKIQNSKEYYYIVVSDEIIFNNYKIYNEYMSKLKPKFSKYIPIYLNISEYEYLIMAISNRQKPIDILIKHYHKNYYNSNFYDLIIKEGKTLKLDRLNLFDNFFI